MGVIVGGVLAAASLAVVAWLRRQSAAQAAVGQRIAAIAEAAGFERFGNPQDAWTLMFRSPGSMLKVEWEKGYVYASLAPRRGDTRWVDDDLLRQALLGEAGDADGVNRQWRDVEAFVRFLGEYLAPMEAAVTSPDPEVRAAIESAARQRGERVQRWLDSMQAPHRRRSAPGGE